MNKGIEELKKHLPEIQKKADYEFFQKICERFLKEKHLEPLRMVMDTPYLLIKVPIDNFTKSNIQYIGNEPNWDLNWGHMFYCIKAKFDWKKGLVSLVFRNENEGLNKQRLCGNKTGLIEGFVYRLPPNLSDW